MTSTDGGITEYADGNNSHLECLFTKRKISHEEAREIAGRLINSHFRKEPHARASIPALPDYDDDLLIIAYIRQQAALAAQKVEWGGERGTLANQASDVDPNLFAAQKGEGVREELPSNLYSIVANAAQFVELTREIAPPDWWGTWHKNVSDDLAEVLTALNPVLAYSASPSPAPEPSNEPFADKVARLQREIGARQMELQTLVLGDPSKCVTFAAPEETRK